MEIHLQHLSKSYHGGTDVLKHEIKLVCTHERPIGKDFFIQEIKVLKRFRFIQTIFKILAGKSLEKFGSVPKISYKPTLIYLRTRGQISIRSNLVNLGKLQLIMVLEEIANAEIPRILERLH